MVELRQLSFRYMQDGFSIVDANGLHLDVNPAFCAMTGFSAEELIGSGPEHCYWPPEERENIQAAFTKNLSGDFADVELIFMRKNGERFPVLVNPFAIRDQSGLITFYAATVKDITQRVKLQETLRDSEDRYRRLFESAADAIVILQGEKIFDCNAQALEMFGVASIEQLAARSTFNFFPPKQPDGRDSRTFSIEKLKEASTGKPQFFAWHHVKLDGTLFEAEVSLSTFKQGETTFIQAIIRDITQRTTMDQALKDSELRFRTLFENAGDAISILKDGQTIDFNNRLCEIYGFTREEILAIPVIKFFPPTQPNGQASSEFFAERLTAAQAGFPQMYEWYGRRKDGALVITEVNLNMLVIGGQVFQQAVARDITQRKEMEAALVELTKTLDHRVKQRTAELVKANTELQQRNNQFRALAAQLTKTENDERKRIARVLHDNQQQLLVAAKFKAEMLQNDSYDSVVKTVGRKLVEILEQAIDVTRTLTMELAPPILYGAGLVVALEWLAQWMKEHHKLEVVVTGSLPVTPVPAGVSSLLFQAVRELLLNVIKHSGAKKASVTVAMTDELLSVAVTDEGVGFDVASALTSPQSFGLFSIQERLSLLGGRLEIVSVPGLGTTTTLSVSLAKSDVSPLSGRRLTDWKP